MAGGGGETGSYRTLEYTPTWAVAGVCAVIILVSIALENILHKVGTWLTNREKKALYEALEKIKAELMTLGFISLILVFFQYYIAKICIPTRLADTMMPCHLNDDKKAEEGSHRRRLLSFERRVLSEGNESKCMEGKVSLISAEGLHQLHILVFFLAVFHVIYCAITVTLGRLKCRSWKQWERDTNSADYDFSKDPSRFRLSHETSFVRAHTSFWSRNPLSFYIECFFRQFFSSVSKSDYLTLRNGFITVHLEQGSKFNFIKYIKKSLQDDFKTVVGVSPVLWGSFVVFLLLNVNGWQVLFWASVVPLFIILAVGTELQAILTKMALQIADRHAIVQGIPLVEASDKFFWFGQPRLVLHLIHFALFQNAFQLTYFLWIWYEFGINSCFHENFGIVIAKICLGIGVLLLCSYITLPLYALIAQMGTHMKKSIFDEQMSKAVVKKWDMAVKKHGAFPTRTLGDGSANPTSSNGMPFHPEAGHATLYRFKSTGHSTMSAAHGDQDGFDLEDPSTPAVPTASLIIRMSPQKRDNDQVGLWSEIDMDRVHSGDETRKEDDFSSAKQAPSTSD